MNHDRDDICDPRSCFKHDKSVPIGPQIEQDL